MTNPYFGRSRSRAVLASGLVLISLAMTACAGEALTPLDVSHVQQTTTSDRVSYSGGNYSGWWDHKPLPGQPTELVLYNTASQKVVKTIGSPGPLSMKNMEFLRSPKWAKNAILVMEPATNTVRDSFSIDASGFPKDKPAIASSSVRSTGYEGWWNSTPLDGDVSGLPVETVQIDTATNQVVDGFNRTTGATDIDYKVVPDPTWPRRSIVIVDTSNNKVIDSFPIDRDGIPLR